MENLSWFDNPKFRSFCQENSLEPMIRGDNILVLVCPKAPADSIKKELTNLIPSEVPWKIEEGMNGNNIAQIGAILEYFQVKAVRWSFGKDHTVTCDIPHRPGNVATQPGSPIWDKVAWLIRNDPFTNTYKIMVGDELYRDSTGYKKPVDYEDLLEPSQEQDPVQETKPIVPIKDDRFNRDRDFLPKDVVTDLTILLESCKSVDDFLKNI